MQKWAPMLLMIRLPLIILWIIFSTMLGIIACILRPFNPGNIRVTTRVLQYGRYILGINILFRNKEIMDQNRPCVFISNHQDNLDVFMGAMALPKRTVSIGKKSIIFIPFFGLYYWLSGNILIDRSNKRKAFAAMDIAAKTIKDKNISVWIMPEGTRSKGRGLLPFKKGPFLTAIKAGVPIVPIVWSNYTKDLKLNRWNAGTIIMEVLPPIQTAGLSINDVNILKDEAYIKMNEAITNLDLEVKKIHEQA